MVLCPLQQPVAVAPGALRSYLQAIRHKLVSPGRTVLRVRCHFVAMAGEVSRLPRRPGRALRLRTTLPVAVAGLLVHALAHLGGPLARLPPACPGLLDPVLLLAHVDHLALTPLQPGRETHPRSAPLCDPVPGAARALRVAARWPTATLAPPTPCSSSIAVRGWGTKSGGHHRPSPTGGRVSLSAHRAGERIPAAHGK